MQKTLLRSLASANRLFYSVCFIVISLLIFTVHVNAVSASESATSAVAIDPLARGHGGPILLITKNDSPFSLYYSEILRAEGLNSFTTIDIADVTPTVLAQYDVALLGDIALSDAQVQTITSWVNDTGGNLIAMHPDKKLAPLLGLTVKTTKLADAYLKVTTTTAPGAGIVADTIQYHGSADRYTLMSGTTAVAKLYSTATTATADPAVSMRSVGTNGGQAVAFTYDLARSVVYTHQGNPLWSGDDRDGNGVIRPNDLFYGAKTGDVKPDYVDLNKVAIPQADEQQRLLANIIEQVNLDKEPLPKLAYFPYNKKAVVVLAADDHATATGTVDALTYQLANSPSGCSVMDWQCIRSTSLIYTSTNLTDAQANTYHNQGFDFGVHTSTGCGNWTPASLSASFDSDLADFQSKYTSLPAQHVNRIHCIAWSNYVGAAKIEAQKGLRLDLNYYYWPGSWVQDRPGFMTGSGYDMRFADTNGALIDTYQLPSHLVNESGQTFPRNIDTMLDRALGPEGYYGVLGTHYDYSDSFDRQLIQSALARQVPLVSGQQMLDWNDARNNSYFTNASWTGNNFKFTATVDAGARSMMRGLLPINSKNGVLLSLKKGSTSLSYTTETIKGVSYAVFDASSGVFTANYGTDTTPPVVQSTAPANGAKNVNVATSPVVTFSEPLKASTVNSNTVKLKNGTAVVPSVVTYNATNNSVTIKPSSPLTANVVYKITITTGLQDVNGVALANMFTSQFTTGITTYSLWSPAAQVVSTSSETANVELGLQFTTSQAGSVKAISFYKSASDGVSSRTMTLWDAAGVALGSATSTNETSSGWQTATLTTPIAVSPGQTYTASYSATSGQYSFTSGGLSQSFTNGPLTALANGGVYQYGGGFPTSSFGSTNYWVDVTLIN